MIKGTLPNGTNLSLDPMTTHVGSPDGAQRNPGIDGDADRFSRIPLALHAGYSLRLMPFERRIHGQKCLS